MKYGRLTVLERRVRNGRAAWLCRCDCGTVKEILAQGIKNGTTKACGCLHQTPSRRSHGMSSTRTYTVWLGIVKRCTNRNEPAYPQYGGRGILVCRRWRRFVNFLADMGEAPLGLTLERTDNDGNYEPGNCRWASRGEQARNTRRTIRVTFAGETLCVKDWAARFGLKASTLYAARQRGRDVTAYFPNGGTA